MLRKNALSIALLAAIILLIALFYRSEVGRVIPNPPPSTLPAPTTSLPPLLVSESKIENSKSKIPALERSTLADSLNSPRTDLTADLRLVLDIISNFRSNLPRDGNPVGSNAEITAALTGQNKLRLALIPPDHPAINRDGELCDRWGTPFFFHAESGTRMLVQSAGPDKKLHTADDVALSP